MNSVYNIYHMAEIRNRKFILPTVFFLIIAFVGIITILKVFYQRPVYVYAKVKVGQGSWWAVTAKPPVWIVNSLSKNQVVYDTVGRPNAQVIAIKKYPLSNNSFDMYLTLKLKVSYNKKTSSYTFNRSPLSIASPIELTFSNASITGTVIDIAAEPFQDQYVTKTVTLENREGFINNSPVISEDINPGDTYSDGTQIVMTVLSNESEISSQTIGSIRNRKIKLKVVLQKKSDGLYYGEEYKIANNSTSVFATNNYFFSGFTVTSIE